MHSILWLFNPNHDMAIANNSSYYISSNKVNKMMSDLSFFPAWFVFNDEESNDVLVSNETYKLLKNSSLKVIPNVDAVCEINKDYDYIHSWGWNRSILKMLDSLDVPMNLLPSLERLNHIRQISNRETSVNILPLLKTDSDFCGDSFVAYSVDEIIFFLDIHSSIVVKAPWSGSGRGIHFIKREIGYNDERWILNTLRMQNSIIVEPLYNKVVDFAMEFYINSEGEISFCGYSFFDTDGEGAYKKNILASNEMIETILGKYVSVEKLNMLKKNLLYQLSDKIKSYYIGIVGVDMMICVDKNNSYKIHPCVEINFRMNMGIASRIFYDRYVFNGKKGELRIEYYDEKGLAISEDNKMEKLYPLKMKNGKILSGYLSLTPVSINTNYQIYALISE